MTAKYYKILGPDGKPCHGGTGKWKLPKGDKPGGWMPRIDDIVPCERGYHLCRPQDVLNWLGESIYEAEIEDGAQVIVHDDNGYSSKIVTTGRIRLLRICSNWNEYTARLFACDVAERQLKLYESHYPGDNRVRACIDTARRFANGKADRVELAAAWSAAMYAANAARYAAWSAADAAWSAAAAARYAAWSAADAAWSAAMSAANAARYAAWSAADAAGSAERKWQSELLLQYIEGAKP